MLTFKGISFGFGGCDLTDTVQLNIKLWLDWGLLHHGAYGTARLNAESAYASSPDQLKPIYDERYGTGHVWEGLGCAWVWESGVNAGNPPFRVSGIYIDNTFVAVDGVGPYSFHVDYQYGRIIFDNSQSLVSDIRAEYCYKLVQVEPSDHPAFISLLQLSAITQLEDPLPSGMQLKEMRAMMPVVFIDQRGGGQCGLELGGGQIKKREIVLHIFADDPKDRNLLMDWLDKQSRASFRMFDPNLAPALFDEYGTCASGITNWPDLVERFAGYKLRVMEGRVSKVDCLNPNIFRGRVTWQVEIDVPGV